MLEQVAHPDARTVGCRIGPALNFGHILIGEVVETELAVVAKLEDRERGASLGHRGDAEKAVGGEATLVDKDLDDDARHIGEPAVLEDALYHSGNMGLGLYR